MDGLPNARFLPVTIGVLAVLLGVKAIALTETALAGESGEGTRAPAIVRVDRPSDPLISPHPKQSVIVASAAPGHMEPSRSVSDPSLLVDLQQEKASLDRERSALKVREAAADAVSEALERRMTALDALNHKLAESVTSRQAQDEAAWAGLVKVYEAMRPDDAATIFNGLEIHTLLQLLARMNERKAALVLGAMQPERARVATQMLAQQRLRDPIGSTPVIPQG